MAFALSRLWILLVSILLPRGARAEWSREWIAELAYRVRCKVSHAYLLRSARGALRDAACIRAQTPFSFRFLAPPLRAESLLVALALLLCVWNGAIVPARPSYANLDRLFRFDRDMRFMGFHSRYLRSSFLARWKKTPGVEQVALYNLHVLSPFPYASVSSNFFEVLGVKPAHGGLLVSDVGPATAVITHQFWRTTLHSSPRAIGSTFQSGKRTYTVAGILEPGFRFNHCAFFTPLGNDNSFNTVTLLKPGVSRKSLEARLSGMTDLEKARLRPLVLPFSQTGILLAALLVMLPIAYWLLRRRKITLYIGARIITGLLGVIVINLATARAINHFPILSMLQFWLFCGLCAAVVYFVLRDQRSRCPVCLERLSMPVPIGSWSSLILDRPATEYVCPAGHGVLFVSEALHDPNQWTVLDQSWQDLFAETTT